MVYFQIDFLKRRKNPDEMNIKDELVLHVMTQVAAYDIEYNIIRSFQTIKTNTPG